MSDLIRREDVLAVLCFSKETGQMVCGDLRKLLEQIKAIPSAEPERHRGEWIEVHGYATPGGDPVWKCSECGKGIHVYGIEAPSYNRDYTDGHQWVACPNCGAEMTR